MKGERASKTRLYRHKGDFTWQGIKTENYKPKGGDWADIVRQVIVGNKGESARFHFRYFEIEPGGNSSFEKHRHEHVVICIRGRGKVLTGKRSSTMHYLDTLYIEPGVPHQLSNPFDDPFGFFCIVNARRDKPTILSKGPATQQRMHK